MCIRDRYYSPELKRFINADIIVGDLSNSQTLNRYAYANGNPISNIDPFGLSADRTDSSWLDYLYHGLQYLTKPFVDGFKWATQKGYFDWLLKLGLGATPDDDNIYHIRQDVYKRQDLRRSPAIYRGIKAGRHEAGAGPDAPGTGAAGASRAAPAGGPRGGHQRQGDVYKRQVFTRLMRAAE